MVRASSSSVSSSSVTVGANIEGGVLGEKCLMESIGIGSRYCQRNRFGGPREHRYAPFEGSSTCLYGNLTSSLIYSETVRDTKNLSGT